MSEVAPEHPEWRGRLDAARQCTIPWIERHIPLAGRTVLEYGCGQGAISCAIAPRAARHIGVDIDAGEVAMAREHVARRKLENVELHVWPVDEILNRVADFRGQIDVFLLYAVLEHLTVDERLAVLRLAREVVRDDGHIVVCETPNRLTPIDHHTARMPAMHLLPSELAARHYPRSPRSDFVAAIDAAAREGVAARDEALIRWGTGVSFHEFEVVFDDLAAHTVASSYHEQLYAVRPVRWEELQLAAVLEAWRPDLPPCWSRTWVDTILSARARPTAPEFVRPWPLRVPHDVPGAAMLADGRIELRPGAWLPVTLPHPTTAVHVGLMAADPAHALLVEYGPTTASPVATANEDGIPPWHATLDLSAPTATFRLGLRDGGCLTYVGYAGDPDPDAKMRRPMGW